MKKWVVLGLCVVVVGMWVGVAYGLYSKNVELRARVRVLAEENTDLMRDRQHMENDSIGQTWSGSMGQGGSEDPVTIRGTHNGAGFAFPIAHEDYWITSPYGDRVSPLLNVRMAHNGVDIASVWRAQVVASRSGTVVTHYPPPDAYFSGHPVYGGYVVIDHGESMTKYAHLQRSYVREGQEVQKGQVIGRMGSTGQTTGMHLHYEVEVNGETVNPLLYIEPQGEK